MRGSLTFRVFNFTCAVAAVEFFYFCFSSHLLFNPWVLCVILLLFFQIIQGFSQIMLTRNIMIGKCLKLFSFVIVTTAFSQPWQLTILTSYGIAINSVWLIEEKCILPKIVSLAGFQLLAVNLIVTDEVESAEELLNQ